MTRCGNHALVAADATAPAKAILTAVTRQLQQQQTLLLLPPLLQLLAQCCFNNGGLMPLLQA